MVRWVTESMVHLALNLWGGKLEFTVHLALALKDSVETPRVPTRAENVRAWFCVNNFSISMSTCNNTQVSN